MKVQFVRLAILCVAAAGAMVTVLLMRAPQSQHDESLSALTDPDSESSLFKLRSNVEWLRLHEPESERLEYLEALLHYLEIRTYPRGEFDQNLFEAAIADRERMTLYGPHALADWEFVGPKNLQTPSDNQWFGKPPLSGRVNAIEFDPTDARRYYIGSPSGGLWYTSDDGANWTVLSDKWMHPQVSTIALKPGDPNTILVGTGDFHGRRPPYSLGIMKSTDGGANWTRTFATESANQMVSKVLFDPENPDVILVTTGNGVGFFGNVWRSPDGGLNWVKKIETHEGNAVRAAWSDVKYGAMSPTTGTRFYYASGKGFNKGQVWRSADKGKTWTKLNPPTDFPDGDYMQCVEVAPSVVNPDTVYVMMARQPKPGTTETTGFSAAQLAWARKCKIWKSTRAGNDGTWTEIMTDFPRDDEDMYGYNWSQCGYDAHLTPSYRVRENGSKVDILYAGLITLSRYDDETGRWRDIGQTYHATRSELLNDQQSLAVFPTDPTKVLVGCDGGLFRGVYDEAGDAWTFPSLNGGNRGLFITEFYHAAFHPKEKNMVVGGTQDNAGPASVAEIAGTWQVSPDLWSNVSGGDGNFSAIDPKEPAKQYTSNNRTRIRKTADMWKTQTALPAIPLEPGELRNFVAPIALDEKDPRWLYYVGQYLYYYGVHDNTWRGKARTVQRICGVKAYGTAVTPATADNNIVYTGALDGNVYRFRFQSPNWTATRIDRGMNAGTSLPALPVTSIAVHPTNANKVYVTLGGLPIDDPPPGTVARVWMCADTSKPDAERQWVSVSGNAEPKLDKWAANWIALDPDSPDTKFYVGMDTGIFYTNNGGNSWVNGGSGFGLPNVSVRRVQVVKTTNVEVWINVATFGRGIWRIRR